MSFKMFHLLLSILITADEEDFSLSQQCLSCLCEAISSCDTEKICYGSRCGPFRINAAFWADSGKPTINNEALDSPTAFYNCATDLKCSSVSVQGYMKTFQDDCNRDGKIDCDDFIVIQKFGAFAGCQNLNLTIKGIYAEKYQQCKATIGVI